LIQNADDAGATEVGFLFDERNHGIQSLENPDLARFQGSALYCHNNATFKEDDWEGIRNLMKSNKKEDPLKIGRFGIGFNSVYHITGIYIFLRRSMILIPEPMARSAILGVRPKLRVTNSAWLLTFGEKKS
jgi:sacsin